MSAVATIAPARSAISLLGAKIPCSGAKNSLFAAEQGNRHKPLRLHVKSASRQAKQGKIKPISREFPDNFPVLREFARSGSGPPRRLSHRLERAVELDIDQHGDVVLERLADQVGRLVHGPGAFGRDAK